MPELSVAGVAQYTGSALSESDDETERLLAAALGLARRYCGWHVTPVLEDDEVTLDGTGTCLLVLPTLKVVELTSITEDGVDLAEGISQSARAPGCLFKESGGLWTRGYSNIVVTYTHGYEEAREWQSAVLSLVDRWSDLPAGGKPNVVGPFKWASESPVGEAFTATERYLLDSYRLERPA